MVLFSDFTNTIESVTATMDADGKISFTHEVCLFQNQILSVTITCLVRKGHANDDVPVGVPVVSTRQQLRFRGARQIEQPCCGPKGCCPDGETAEMATISSENDDNDFFSLDSPLIMRLLAFSCITALFLLLLVVLKNSHVAHILFCVHANIMDVNLVRYLP